MNAWEWWVYVVREGARRLAWRRALCSGCKGNPSSVASWSDPFGCWDCRNQGWTPVRRWRWLAARMSPPGA